jgi:hypothetical protein
VTRHKHHDQRDRTGDEMVCGDAKTSELQEHVRRGRRNRNRRHLSTHGDINGRWVRCIAENGAAEKAPYKRADQDKWPAFTGLA